MSKYKNWGDLNFDERVKVIEAFQNTEDRNESDKDNPKEEDVKDYYEDNAENFGFRYLKYCCRRGKCVEVKRDVGDKTRVISYKPKESIELFPECKSCGYGKFYTSYENENFIDKAWKSCLLKRGGKQ